MTFINANQWPNYTYVIPHLYTKAKVRLIGVGSYFPKFVVTNDFFDTIIGASSSDNDAFPTVAGWLQLRLGLGPIRTNMLKGACACQTESFQVAAEVLTTSTAQLILVFATEGLLPNDTHILDWKTSSLFGEGAAAFLFERSDEDTYFISGSDTSQAQSLFYQTPLRKDAIEMAEVDMKVLQLYREGR